MKRENIRVHPFGKHLTLNPFGDYDRLQMRATQEDGSEKPTIVWSLLSSRGATEETLNEEERVSALENIFFQGAVNVTPQ